MFEPTQLLLFLAAGITLNLTPGPDMIYVINRSVYQGPKAGVVSALGIGAGSIVHCLAAALGVSAVLMYSATAFMIIKFAGAAYLIYLGVRTFLSTRNKVTFEPMKAATLRTIFWQGAITNILNPKVALFFLAFLPQFVNVSYGHSALQIVVLGTLFNVTGTTINALIGLFFGYAGARLMQNPRVARIQKWVTGSVFCVLGGWLALEGRK